MRDAGRRDFMKQVVLGGAALLAARSARAADSRVEVLVDEPIGTISPMLYGHFVEHIGGVIYDGIWVGEDSKISNVGGIRKALVDALRPIKPSVIRWPGGCFADSYDWRDGVGPRTARPCRTNFWNNDKSLLRAPAGPQKYESNHFGTNEFVRFCRMVDAEPYLAVNLRSLTAYDFDQWVEYCNAPAGATTLARQREANGERDPLNVRYWGVGNESWGCGGEFTPEEYATEFRKFTAWVPQYGTKPAFIASGPAEDDWLWTRRFFGKLTERSKGYLKRLFGWALHYYCGTSGKGSAIDFTDNDWYELLGKADRMESLITRHWQAMSETDPEHLVKLVVDEWGAWHEPGTEIDPAYLFCQMPTLRDALVSALTLDTFNRHADKVAMANAAQLINNLHCLFLARGDQFVATTNYYVFEMYSAHQGGQSLRTVFSGPRIAYQHDNKPESLWALAGSASLHQKQLVLTVVNPHVSQAREAEIVVRGATVRAAQARVLTANDIHTHNSFANPRAVVAQGSQVNVASSSVVYRFAPASVTRLDLSLA